jgi:hypothetical protein
MELKRLKLKCGPLEAFQESRFNHALRPGSIGNVSYGMWDHRTDTGYIDVDRLEAHQKASATKTRTDNIAPAPPIKDGDKDWDM